MTNLCRVSGLSPKDRHLEGAFRHLEGVWCRHAAPLGPKEPVEVVQEFDWDASWAPSFGDFSGTPK